MNRNILIALIAFFLSISKTKAQSSIELVKKLSFDGNMMYSTELNGYFVFFHNNEIWKSDGTDAGTQMIKVIDNKSTNSKPTLLKKVGNRIFFIGDDGIHGKELWVSDGTVTGTNLVKDINPFGDGLNYWLKEKTAQLNDQLYFYANDSLHGTELWKTDGTSLGTQMVSDINKAYGIGSIDNVNWSIAATSRDVVFTADDGTSGTELWKTDGTESGTKQINDLNAGVHGSNPHNFVTHENQIFFSAQPNIPTSSISSFYVYAALADTAKLLASGLRNMTVDSSILNGQLYFLGYGTSMLTGLWKTDGTPGGTSRVKQMFGVPGIGNFTTYNKSIINYNGQLLFQGMVTSSDGHELCISDGTENGTRQLLDLEPVNSPTYKPSSAPRGFTIFNDKAYFFALTTKSRVNIYETDGTEAGTRSILPNNVDTSMIGAIEMQRYYWQQFTQVGNSLFFINNYSQKASEYAIYKIGLFPKFVENQSFIDKITLHPNPGNSFVHFSLANSTKVCFYNSHGSLILQQMLTNKDVQTIDISSLSNGLYPVVVDYSDGEKATTIFVKQ